MFTAYGYTGAGAWVCTKCDARHTNDEVLKRIVQCVMHRFCPKCFGCCKWNKMAQLRTAKAVDEMAPEQLEVFLETPKICRKCRRDLKVKDFPMTSAYGKRVVRSWCNECMRAYYRAKNDAKRSSAIDQ